MRKNRAVNSQTSLTSQVTAAPLASRPAADASIPLSPTSATKRLASGDQPVLRRRTTRSSPLYNLPLPAGLPSLASSATLISHRFNKNDVLVDATKRACTASLLRGRADGIKGNRRSIDPKFFQITPCPTREMFPLHSPKRVGRTACKRRITHVRKTLVCAWHFAASVVQQRLDPRFPICTIPNF